MALIWLISGLLWAAFAVYNYAFITKKIDFHFWGAAVSVIFALFVPLAIFLNLSFVQIIGLPFVILTVRWIVFDITLNLLMGKKWWYFGNTTRGLNGSIPYFKNGAIDRKLGAKQFIFKFIFLVISIILSF